MALFWVAQAARLASSGSASLAASPAAGAYLRCSLAPWAHSSRHWRRYDADCGSAANCCWLGGCCCCCPRSRRPRPASSGPSWRAMEMAARAGPALAISTGSLGWTRSAPTIAIAEISRVAVSRTVIKKRNIVLLSRSESLAG